MSPNLPSKFRLFLLLHFLFVLPFASGFDGVTYTNFTRPGPIEIHMVRVSRQSAGLEFQTLHSGDRPIGKSPVSEQLKLIKTGKPLAAINGDFYQLDGAFAGDPRGLQISNGRLISAPAGTSAFWLDSRGAPHIAVTRSALRVTWPDGSTSPLGLNGQCDSDELELYTPDLAASRRGNSGREIILIPQGNEANFALRPSHEYNFKISGIRPATNTPIPANACLLTLGPTTLRQAPGLSTGAIVKINTGITPNLRGATTAISGGPILIAAGQPRRFDKPASAAYQDRFVAEKHPRSAFGWSKSEYFLVQVDGRQKTSIGVTLNELGALMLELGCDEAMNLDGGGSATLWFDGKVRNRPSDGAERAVANSLALILKPAATK